jgi:hypothetical protein
LLLVRVPTCDVELIDASLLGDVLASNLVSVDQKLEEISAGNLQKIQGDWCYGCTANCEFKKAYKWSNNSHIASVHDLGEFIKNVKVVTQKTIAILQGELNVQESSC